MLESGRPSWKVALIPFAFLVAIIVCVVSFFGADALAGGSQVALLLASAAVVAISMRFYKVPWACFEESISNNIKTVSSAILILLLIGGISGTWMVSGVVPTLICYGLKIITPKLFLFAACVICAVVSIMTGSSWTTIATIGIALIGIGTAQGYSAGWIAGAIISGAYFGDKVSPLSDTTVLASSSSETPLFVHIRYMLYTTVPSIAIALLVFLVVSLTHHSDTAVDVAQIEAVLRGTFVISPWLLVVPLLTGILIVKKVPAMITLSSAIFFAVVASLIAQPHIIQQIADPAAAGSHLSFRVAFTGVMVSIYDATSIQTGNEMLDSLVATRGMNGMLSTIFLIICAVTFGGVLSGSGMMESLTQAITNHVKGRTGMVGATVFTGLLSNMVVGDQYLSIILTSNLYKHSYRSRGLESRLLSRSVEDSATITSVLVPWNSCGMTQATVLRVATLEYLPYCIFNYLSPLISIFVAAIGYKIIRIKPSADGNQAV